MVLRDRVPFPSRAPVAGPHPATASDLADDRRPDARIARAGTGRASVTGRPNTSTFVPHMAAAHVAATGEFA